MNDLTGLEVIIDEPGTLGEHGGALAAFSPIDVDAGPARWLAGVKFHAATATTPTGRRVDLCDVMGIPTPGSLGDLQSYHSFEIGMALECSMLSLERAELTAALTEAYSKWESVMVAGQLERDRFSVNSGSLASTATNLANGDKSLVGAFNAIEHGLAARLGNDRGIIHMPLGLLSTYVAEGLVERDGDSFRTAGVGHRVAADAGYLGVSPVTEGVVVGQFWLYGSGAVRYRSESEVRYYLPFDSDQAQSRSVNVVQARRAAILAWDSTTVVAAQINFADNSLEY